MTPVKIPHELRETIERVHGERGRQWLMRLPALLSECRARWSLELEEPFENLSYNLVIPAKVRGGADVVLKVGVPCAELLTEAAALNSFAGEGAVRLLHQEAERGILLMERVAPGTPLYEAKGEEDATRTAARLMLKLWRAPAAEHTFPNLARWFNALERLRGRFGDRPFPPDIIAMAEDAFAELNASSRRIVLLHGDLHHANILYSSARGWVAIDPKGIVGDTGYEVGTFMINRLPVGASESELMDTFSRRLRIFSEELEIERERLKRWAFCHAVLSGVWSFEDSEEWQRTIGLARVLSRIE